MTIWILSIFSKKSRIINLLPLAYAKSINNENVTIDTPTGETDWIGQPIPCKLATVSGFNKSTGAFTFSYVQLHPEKEELSQYKTNMFVVETRDQFVFSSGRKRVAISKKPTDKMLNSVVDLAVSNGELSD
ncbi:TPA: hypothetical protein ACGW1T_003716 [Raoultella ornithinolytica]|uniref:hypothetical protein n=1 Tax=Raoultella ornithinolytica TaxID=54291 RepID=UPI00358E1D95